MFLLPAYHLRRTIVVYVAGAEYRFLITRTVRRKLLQVVMQFLVDIPEVYLYLYVESLFRLLREDMRGYILLESSSELGDILYLQRQTDSVCMTSEVLQQVATALYCIIDIIACDTTGRTCRKVTATGKNHRWTIVKLSHSRCHDAHNTLLPVLVVEHDTGMMLLTLEFLDNLVGLFSHLLVHILTLLIVFIDTVGFCESLLEVALHQQVYRLGTVLHASRSIDTWTDLEYYIAHREFASRQSAYLDDRLYTHRWRLIQLL